MSNIAMIGCIVGVISCVIGVASFISAQLAKANNNGRLLEKVEYTCRGIDDIRKEMKDKNKEIDRTIDEHTIQITTLQAEVKTIKQTLEGNNKNA
jgi:septal ring factor EnvC (AmiA/AmiB activator)